MKLNRATITLGVLGVLVLVLLVGGCSSYNSMVTLDEGVDQSWANVQSAYQRRMDLIPNLVNTVKGYAAHEKSTLEGVTAQRTGVSAAQVDKAEQELIAAKDAVNSFNGPDSKAATPEQLANVDRAYGRYMNLVVEAYPDLKANENFLSLQDELAGTENRINTERNRYNTAVRHYNIKIRRFPAKIFAGLFGFDTKQPFAADQGAEKAPTVEF